MFVRYELIAYVSTSFLYHKPVSTTTHSTDRKLVTTFEIVAHRALPGAAFLPAAKSNTIYLICGTNVFERHAFGI
eukprot:492146-Rhodomonas_salina.4